MQKVVIIGDGGHSKVIQEIILSNKDLKLVAILDDCYKEVTRRNNVTYGPINDEKELLSEKDALLMIGIGNNETRKNVVHKLALPNERYITLIHTSAIVSRNAQIGYGTVVMARSVVQAGSTIGSHVILNTGSIVEHDNLIGDYAHISPGTILTGNVTIGEGTHIGAGTVIIPSCAVGDWCIIGAGSTVTREILDGQKAYGVPAKVVT